eukprot:TRINITY_DN61052_c0_g1_i1.p1 TRINITY_DN61052_c0_g1~~TRINITY_DN61052_c0_g1_i1.p1  ORF type:complete len:110 (+),score=20.83 TRINITY_DN61052_c0_g1_i1:189-518(+)
MLIEMGISGGVSTVDEIEVLWKYAVVACHLVPPVGYHLGEGPKCDKGEREAWQRRAASGKGIRGSDGGERRGVVRILAEKESRRRKGRERLGFGEELSSRGKEPFIPHL